MAETEEPDITALKPEQTERKNVIAFQTNLAATSGITLVSDKISHHYKITKIEAHFPDNSAYNLDTYAFVGSTANAPTATPPPDHNLLSRFAPSGYLTGKSGVIVAEIEYIPTFYENYIKVYFYNNNAYAVDCLCLVCLMLENKPFSSTSSRHYSAPLASCGNTPSV